MKTYVEISVEKELPKESEEYFVVKRGNKKFKDVEWYDKHGGSFISRLEIVVTHWIKPFSLPGLMEEYTVWLKKNYDSSYEDGWRKFGTADCFTEKELLNDFLTQKGIL